MHEIAMVGPITSLQQQFVGYLRSHFIVWDAHDFSVLRSSLGIPFVVRHISALNKPEEGRAATNLNKIIQVDVFVCATGANLFLFTHARRRAPRGILRNRAAIAEHTEGFDVRV
jgi:hypothetical protein